jgi:hypothetical protein
MNGKEPTMKRQRLLFTAVVIFSLIGFVGCASMHAGRAPEKDTAAAVSYARPGFHTQIEDGRLWVFKEGAKEFDEFKNKGELAKHVIRPGAGPGGITLKAPDAETLDDYLSAR